MTSVADAASRRAEAIRQTGMRRDPTDVSTLAAALDDSAPAVRAMACRALGWQRDPGLAPTMAAALGDPDATVRQHAARGLAVSLGRGGAIPSAVAEPLLSALRDPQSAVRAAAARTTGWTGLAGAITPLGGLLTDDPEGWVRAEAAHALGRLGATGAIRALLRALADSHAGARHHAARALALLGATEAVAALTDCLDDPDAEVRVAALRALDRFIDPGEAIERALADANPGVRATAAILAGRRSAGSPSTVAAMSRALATEDHPEVRHHLARALIRRAEQPPVEGEVTSSQPHAAKAESAVRHPDHAEGPGHDPAIEL